MLAFPRELQSLSTDELYELIDRYFVRSHDGTPYQGSMHATRPDRRSANSIQMIRFILEWTQPDNGPIKQGNVIEAIQQGVRFDPNEAAGQLDAIITAIFGSLKVSSDVINDFADYPINSSVNWGNTVYDGWDVLTGYTKTDDRRAYFEYLTEQSYDDFLNETERVFYLTRGYGRPNKYISRSDLVRRQLLLSAHPSALIPLMDILKICPDKQDPEIIREHLSNVNLVSLDSYHINAIQEVSNCLNGASCNISGCSVDHVECFKSLLRTLGVLDEVEYNPSTGVLESNLSQLNLYQNVVPGKEWSFNEVKDLPDPLVEGVLAQLPDRQLLKIEVPSGLKLRDGLDLTSSKSRFRSKLLRAATKFLLSHRYILGESNGGASIYYGRLVDSNLSQMSLSQIENSVTKHQALIDPLGHVMTLVEASSLNSPVLNRIVDRTLARKAQNDRLVASFSGEQLMDLQELFEKLNQIKDEASLEVVKTILQEDDLKPVRLLLYAKSFQEYVPVAITFEEYFKDWYPLYHDLINQTLEYYNQTLQE